MNSSWKARIILAIGVGVIIFGDFLGYGNSSTGTPSNNSERHAEQKRQTYIDQAAAIKEGSTNGKVDV